MNNMNKKDAKTAYRPYGYAIGKNQFCKYLSPLQDGLFLFLICQDSRSAHEAESLCNIEIKEEESFMQLTIYPASLNHKNETKTRNGAIGSTFLLFWNFYH